MDIQDLKMTFIDLKSEFETMTDQVLTMNRAISDLREDRVRVFMTNVDRCNELLELLEAIQWRKEHHGLLVGVSDTLFTTNRFLSDSLKRPIEGHPFEILIGEVRVLRERLEQTLSDKPFGLSFATHPENSTIKGYVDRLDELEDKLRVMSMKLDVTQKAMTGYEGKVLETVTKSAQSRIETYTKKSEDRLLGHVQKTIEQFDTAVDSSTKSKIAELENFATSFTETVVTSDSASYWKTLKKNSGNTALGAFLGFFALGALYVFLAVVFGPKVYNGVLASLKAADVVATPLAIFTIFSFPAGVAFWSLKLVSRVFVENFNVLNRATHREMVLTTYLSMLRDEQQPVKPEERSFALRTIFADHDGAPAPVTPPNMSEFLGSLKLG